MMKYRIMRERNGNLKFVYSTVMPSRVAGFWFVPEENIISVQLKNTDILPGLTFDDDPVDAGIVILDIPVKRAADSNRLWVVRDSNGRDKLVCSRVKPYKVKGCSSWLSKGDDYTETYLDESFDSGLTFDSEPVEVTIVTDNIKIQLL